MELKFVSMFFSEISPKVPKWFSQFFRFEFAELVKLMGICWKWIGDYESV